MRFLRSGWLLLSVFLPLVVLGEEEPQLEVYAVSPAEFEKATALIRPMMTPQGVLHEDRENRRLLILDQPKVHQKIGVLFQKWAPPPRNVRIRVSSASPQRIQQDGVIVTGRGRIGKVVVQSGNTSGRNELKVRTYSNGIQSDLNNQMELLVMSGGKASIDISEQVPNAAWFIAWGQPYHLWASEVKWQDVGSKMVIEPFVLPNNTIRVRLTPSFSYIVDRQLLTTEVQRLVTEVVVADGAEVDLGGLQTVDKEFFQKFLTGFDEYGNTRQIRLKLRATIEELPPRPDYQ